MSISDEKKKEKEKKGNHFPFFSKSG